MEITNYEGRMAKELRAVADMCMKAVDADPDARPGALTSAVIALRLAAATWPSPVPVIRTGDSISSVERAELIRYRETEAVLRLRCAVLERLRVGGGVLGESLWTGEIRQAFGWPALPQHLDNDVYEDDIKKLDNLMKKNEKIRQGPPPAQPLQEDILGESNG